MCGVSSRVGEVQGNPLLTGQHMQVGRVATGRQLGPVFLSSSTSVLVPTGKAMSDTQPEEDLACSKCE